MSRDESKRKTRDELLTAGAGVFGRRGYHGASLAQIAAEAGYTVGAVYSNFGGKEDLLLAIVERESLRVTERILEATASARSASEKLRRGAKEWIAFVDREPELYAVFMEFWAVALRSSQLRDRNVELWGSVRTALGNLIQEYAESVGKRLRLPPDHIGAAVMALGDGLAMQRLEAPDAIPKDLLGAMLGAVVPALLEPDSGLETSVNDQA